MERNRSLTFGVAMLCGAGLAVLLTGASTAGAGDAQQGAGEDRSVDVHRLMTRGKLESDLGRYAAASEAFRTIAEDPAAPDALVWEALVRLGLTLSASDHGLESAQIFRRVLRTYSADPAAMRFLNLAVARAVPGKIWPDFRADFEQLLRSGQVVSTEKLGMPAGTLRKVRVAKGDIELDAVWRSFDVGGDEGASYKREAAAYELDRLLGLDMVPPTIVRAVEGREGSMQLWVYGCRSYGDVEGTAPSTAAWAQRISRAKTFDYLVGNRDRNTSNILVDRGWDLVLIDHSAAFAVGNQGLTALPARFDRRLVERLRSLDEAVLTRRLGSLLDRPQLEAVLMRRDAIVARVEELVAEKGHDALF